MVSVWFFEYLFLSLRCQIFYKGFGVTSIVAPFLCKSTKDRHLVGFCFLYTFVEYLNMEKSQKKDSKLYCGADKPVHVRAYTRVRYGRVEYVCQHCRSNWGSKAA